MGSNFFCCSSRAMAKNYEKNKSKSLSFEIPLLIVINVHGEIIYDSLFSPFSL